MPDTEFQLRRGTAAQNDALTGAVGEITYDTTNLRFRAHDNSKAGGYHVPIHRDIQNGTMTGGTAGGTANALTLALAPAPAAYATGQWVWFIAASDNTGSATLNLNSIGAKTLKRQIAGAKQNLSAGDIKSGRVYWAFYDGTDFVVLAAEPLGYVASSEIAVATGDQTYSLTHGLGAAPRTAEAWLICKTTDLGYAVDDLVRVDNLVLKVSSGSVWGGVNVRVNATSVIATQEGAIYLPNLSSGNVPTLITYANWRLIIRAWA